MKHGLKDHVVAICKAFYWPLVAAIPAAALWLIFYYSSDYVGWLRAFYNEVVLWVVNVAHAHESSFVLLRTWWIYPILLLVIAFLPPYPRAIGFKRKLLDTIVKFFCLALVSLLPWWIFAIVLLVLATLPTFPRSVGFERKLVDIAVTFVFLALLAAWFMYAVYPWQFGRYSPWVCGLLGAGLLYVWLRTSWPFWTPLYGSYLKRLRTYLAHQPRGEDYFSVLSELHQHADNRLYGPQGVQRITVSADDAPIEDVGQTLPALSRIHHTKKRANARKSPGAWLHRFRNLLIRWPRLASLVRRCAPRLPVSLADYDVILYSELKTLREQAWFAAQQELYADAEIIEPLNEDQVKQARRRFRQWLGFTDALGECLLFNATRDPQSVRARCLEAADIFADVSRICLRSTFRFCESKGGPVAFQWFAEFDADRTVGAQAKAKRAAEFVAREQFCLELLCNERPLVDHKLADVKASFEKGWKGITDVGQRMLHLRLFIVRLIGIDLTATSAGKPIVSPLDAQSWAAINDEIIKLNSRLMAGNLSDEDCEVILAGRERFLEYCLSHDQLGLIFANTKDLEPLWKDVQSPNDRRGHWYRHEKCLLGLTHLNIVASNVSADVAAHSLLNALDAFELWHDPSVRALNEYLGRKATHNARGRLKTVTTNAPAPVSPWPVKYSYREVYEGVKSDKPLARRGNYFYRHALYATAAVMSFVLCGAFWLIREGAMTVAPDMRLGGVALHSQVVTLTSGNEGDEPSLWLGTSDDGVHVKAPGHNHHWYHISQEVGQLQTNNVRRIAVGGDKVAYLCAKDERRGLCLSSTPLFSPGMAPTLFLHDWRDMFGFSSFGGVDDTEISVLRQPSVGKCPWLLVGANGTGLGAYSVKQRSWRVLSQVAGLPISVKQVYDVDIARLGEDWHAWFATDDSIAGGILSRGNDDDASALNDLPKWSVLDSDKLVSPHAVQLILQPQASRGRLLYRTLGEGLGQVELDGANVASYRCVVGEDSVPDLEQSQIRHIAYDESEKLIWLADEDNENKSRLSVYREREHRWSHTTEESGQFAAIWDLDVLKPAKNLVQTENANSAATPAGSDSMPVDTAVVLVGTDDGVVAAQVDDKSIVTRKLGPEGERVLRVASGEHGDIGVFSQSGDSAAAFRIKPSAAAMVEDPAPANPDGSPSAVSVNAEQTQQAWKTLIGRGRLPGLTLEEISAVHTAGHGEKLWLGTKSLGIALVDAQERQILTPFLEAVDDDHAAERMNIADLGIVHSPTGEDRWLLAVNSTGTVDATRLDSASKWLRLFNGTSGSTQPDSIGTMKQYHGQLYVGSPNAVSAYSMNEHAWHDVPAMSGLEALHVAGDELWGFARDTDSARASLHRLQDEDQPGVSQWQEEVPDVLAFHAAEPVMSVIDKNRHLWTRANQQSKVLVAPSFLTGDPNSPTLATISDNVLCVAPVGKGVGCYDISQHQWHALELPKTAGTPPKMIHVDQRSFWIVDSTGKLFRTLREIQGMPGTNWSKELVENVSHARFANDMALAVTKDGQLALVNETGVRTLVGDALPFPLDQNVAAACEFEGSLFVAAGKNVARYYPPTHSWQTMTPAQDSQIVRIEPTNNWLYARSDDGRLLRLAKDGNSWTELGSGLASAIGEADSPKVISMRPVVNGLVIVLDGHGVCFLDDDEAKSPQWLLAQSAAMPSEATITTALELGDELYLGTEAHGLWGYYSSIRSDGTAEPYRWRHFPAAQGVEVRAVKKLAAPPGSNDHLAVMSTNGITIYKRDEHRVWEVERHVNKATPIDLAATEGGFLFALSDAGQTRLLYYRLDGKGTVLIGDAYPEAPAATRSVAAHPDSGEIYRLSSAGKLASYDFAQHAWKAEPLPGDAAFDELIASFQQVWAWSRESGKLYSRTDDDWATWKSNSDPTPLKDVVADSQGLLIRHESGSLELLGAGDAREILPATAKDFPAQFTDVRQLAELGPFLIVVAQGHGTYAYDSSKHHWQQLTTGVTTQFAIAGRGEDNRPESYYLLFNNNLLAHLKLVDGNIKMDKVTLPSDCIPREIIASSALSGVYLAAVSGSIHRLDAGRLIDPPLLVPQTLNEAKVPVIRCAAEWGGRLVLGYSSEDGQSVASYNPATLRWDELEIKGGSLNRFLTTGGADERLFAEVQLPIQAGIQLVEISLAKTGELAQRTLPGPLIDATAADGVLWVVDGDERVKQYVPADNSFAITSINADDSLPVDVQAAVARGDELIALLADGNMWHFSLKSLSWSRASDRSFGSLVVAGENIYAVERKSGDFFEYRADNEGKLTWAALPAKRQNSFGSTVILQAKDADAASKPDLWQLEQDIKSGETKISWRAGSDDVHKFATVGWKDKRLDFQRAAQINVHDGALWVTTRAVSAGQRVVRRYKVAEGALGDEIETGLARFQRTQEALTAAFERPAPLAVAGNVFRVQPLAPDKYAGGWPAVDSRTHKTQTLRIELRVDPSNETSMTEVRPVMTTGGKVVFDLDHWNCGVTTSAGFLVGTNGGAVRWDLGQDGTLSRTSVTRTDRPVDLMVAVLNGYMLQTADQNVPLLVSGNDGKSWTPPKKHIAKAKELLEETQSLLASNPRLQTWKVTGKPASLALARVRSEDTIPVTLGPGGFGFDQAVGLELTAETVVLYTPDGRITLDRAGNEKPGLSLEPDLAVSSDVPLRAARNITGHSAVLFPGGASKGNVFGFANGKWNALDEAGAGAVRSELRKVLFEDGNWLWHGDDQVTCKLNPFNGGLRGQFHLPTGRFSFDQVRALATRGDVVWCATDAGVYNWQGSKLLGCDLNYQAPFGGSESVSITFTPGLNDDYFMQAVAKGADRAVLFHYADLWEETRDAEGLAAAQNVLVHGKRWRSDKNAINGEHVERRVFSLADDQATPKRIPVALTPKGWNFENGLSAAGSPAGIAIGSQAGLMSLEPGENATWKRRLMATAAAIVRVEREADELHVQFTGGEELLLQVRPELALGTAPPKKFADIDKFLIQSPRWVLGRTENMLQISTRLAADCELTPVAWGNGRFDFDTMDDVELVTARPLLATDHGFYYRVLDDAGSLETLDGLPKVSSADAPTFIRYPLEDEEVVVVEHPLKTFHQCDTNGKWSAVPESLVAKLGERDQYLAKSGPWRIDRSEKGLAFAFTLPERETQTVEFHPPLGGFLHDYFRTVVAVEPAGDSSSTQLLVGTQGGLVVYDMSGKLVDLDADLDGDGQIDPVFQLWQTATGVLAEVQHAGKKSYFLKDQDSWKSISSEDAQKLIEKTLASIDASPEGWTITRPDPARQGRTAFRLQWNSQPVVILPGVNCRFAHDQALAVESSGEELWFATAGGLLQFKFDEAQGRLRPVLGQHLWVAPFVEVDEAQMEVVGNPFSIRTVEMSGSSQLLVRVSNNGERRFIQNNATSVWEAVESNPEHLVVHKSTDWTWSLPDDDRVQIELASDRYQLPEEESDFALFQNGTFSFWNIDPAIEADGDPIVAHDGWLVATASGLLHFSPSGDLTKFYGKSLEGNAIGSVQHLYSDNTKVLANAGSPARALAYSEMAPNWSAIEDEVPGRHRPVECGWLVWTPGQTGESAVAFRADATDSQDATPTSLLNEGRFLFDRIRSIAADDDVWALTPIGVVRISGDSGVVSHFAAAFGDAAGTLESIHVKDNCTQVVGKEGQLWKWPDGKQFEKVWSSQAEIDSLQEVARNELFACRKIAGGRMLVDFHLPDMPDFEIGVSKEPLMKQGVFGFDDLRDVRIVDDELLAATRLGIWKYSLQNRKTFTIPIDASFFARTGSTQHPMVELGNFVPLPKHDPRVIVYQTNGTGAFFQQPGSNWQPYQGTVAMSVERAFTVENTPWRAYQLKQDLAVAPVNAVQPHGIWTRQGSEAWEGRFLDIVETKSSLWLPLQGRLLWIRKSKL